MSLRALAPLALASLLWLGCSGDVESRMAEVRALQDVGQFTASIDELREILAVSPELAEANYRLGVALAQTGNPSRAVWALQKASESADYKISATLLLSSIQFNLGNYEEAIRAANRVLEIDPSRRNALQIRAKGNLAVKELDLALTDTTRLIELHPDDYPVRVIHATVLAELGRFEEAEEAQFLVKEMSEASGDPQTASRGCLAPGLFAKSDLKDMDRAAELYEDCATKYPADPFVISHIMQFYDSIENPVRGTELIRNAVEEAPESLSLRSTLASRLADQGEPEQAEQVLREAVDSFGSAAAWNMLASHYRKREESEKALEAIEKVIELTGGGGDQIRFTHADLLVDTGDLERAEKVAASLDEPTYATMIRGRILLSRGDAAAALEAFDEGIQNWPNNAGARYLAGAAALQLGDFERAIIEFRESVRVDRTGTDAPRALARLYFERGDYAQAINFSKISQVGETDEQQAEDLKLASRAFAAMGNFQNARSATDRLAAIDGYRAQAAAERATVERLAGGPKAAVAAIEAMKLDLADSANEAALRAYVEHLALDGRFDTAVSAIDSALAASPSQASLHSLRGATLARAGRPDDARVSLERALEIDPKQPEAMGALATIAGRAGEMSEAIELFDRAAKLDPNSDSYPYSAAQLALASGDRSSAKTRMVAIVRTFPGHAESRNDLAWLLAEEGEELDRALTLAEEASRLSQTPDILDTLGYVHLKRGESSAAVSVLERAVESGVPFPTLHYRLGTALSQSGDKERAREMFTAALAAGAFPEADAARRELAQLDQP